MKPEEAIEKLKALITDGLLNVSVEYARDYEEAIQQGISALEKQVAKKVIDSGEKIPFSYYCPSCKEELSDDGYKTNDNYCLNCGQKLDWSEI